MADWEYVAHRRGINICGSWFDDKTGKPLPGVISFAMDERHREFMKKFLDLEPGEIIEDRKFYKWLHHDFKRDFVTTTPEGTKVFDPARNATVVKREEGCH